MGYQYVLLKPGPGSGGFYQRHLDAIGRFGWEVMHLSLHSNGDIVSMFLRRRRPVFRRKRSFDDYMELPSQLWQYENTGVKA